MSKWKTINDINSLNEEFINLNILKNLIDFLSFQNFDIKDDKVLIKLSNALELSKNILSTEELIKFSDMGLDFEFMKIKYDYFFKKNAHKSEPIQENPIPFFKNFISNNPETEDKIKSINIEEFCKSGLPLKYSRKNLIWDMNNLINGLDINDRQKLLNRACIEPYLSQGGEILSYEGFLSSDYLNKNDPLEKSLSDIIDKFTKKNEIISKNTDFNEKMNSLINFFPEYINFIGKSSKQTNSSVDIESIKLLQEVIKNPEYQNLSGEDKFILKLSSLLYIITKTEVDDNEINTRNMILFSKKILDKIKIHEKLKNRIFEQIKNKNWFEEFCSGKANASETALKFRTPTDYQIAQILYQSFIKASQQNLPEDFNQRQKPIKESLEKFFSSGSVIIPSKIVNLSKVPEINHKGKIYKIIDISKIKEDEDMAKYGFLPDVKKRDLRFLTYFVPENFEIKNVLKRIEFLIQARSDKIFSTSLVSCKNNKSIFSRKFGLVFDVENYNILNSFYMTQRSGFKKTLGEFAKNFNEKSTFRNYMKNGIIDYLEKIYGELSDEDYTKIYKQIADKTSFGLIKDINLGSKTIKKEDLIKAILSAQENLFDWDYEEGLTFNEINLCKPQITSVLFKANAIEEISQEVLDFAHEKNLPIILFGNN